MLLLLGVQDIVVVDRDGILGRDRKQRHAHWRRVAEKTNEACLRGGLAEAMVGADLFIGLSVGGLVSAAMVRSMNTDPIVFSLANPEPEIMPDASLAAGAALAASGRFDFPNHCNNVLAFPSLLRGALDTRAKTITPGMCLAAARAITNDVPEDALSISNISPSPMSDTLYPDVAEATARAAIDEGLARKAPEVGAVAANTRRLRGLAHDRQACLAELGG